MTEVNDGWVAPILEHKVTGYWISRQACFEGEGYYYALWTPREDGRSRVIANDTDLDALKRRARSENCET